MAPRAIRNHSPDFRNRTTNLRCRLISVLCFSGCLSLASLSSAQPYEAPIFSESVETCRLMLRENAENAIAFCDEVLESDEATLEGQTRIKLAYASRAVTRGKFAEAEQHLDEVLVDNDVLRQKNIYRYHLLRMKSLIRFSQDNFEESIPYMQEALDLAIGMQRVNSIATSYNDLGAVYLEMGEYSKSLSNLQRALQELEKTDNYYSTGLTLANIAKVYLDLEAPSSSVDYLRRSIAAHDKHLAQRPDDFYGNRAQAQAYEDLGVTYTTLKDYGNARETLEQALAQTEMRMDQMRVLSALADVELSDGDANRALTLLNQALEYEREVPPKRSVEIRRVLVDSHLQRNDLDQALAAASEGLEIARESEQAPDTLFFLEKLMGIAIQQGDPDVALDFQQRYFVAYKSSLEERYQSQIADMQSSIEVRQQAQSIMALESERAGLRRSLRLQQWLIFGAALIVVLLLLIIFLVRRAQLAKRRFISREIAIHRQQFESGEEDGLIDHESESNTGDADELATEAEATSADEDAPDFQDTDECFAVALVSLMRSCVEIWEQNSGQSRIELAEKSKAWQVTVDNGRLRTRTMDRYCDLKKMPKVPRWRQVVRTCRYILINSDLSDTQRQRLNDELDLVFAIQRSRALNESG